MSGSVERRASIQPPTTPSDGLTPALIAGTTSPTEPDRDKTGSDKDVDDFVPCADHDHFDLPVIDEVLEIDVDSLFEIIFTKHPLYRHFQNIKKTTKMELTDWSELNSEGERTRTINYVIAITQSIGPKTANTTEKQCIRAMSRPGQCYIVDSDCVTSGVPYGDNFYLINRFCMNKLSPNSSQLRITSRIIYLKKVWGFIKSFIDKNVKNGTIDSYVLLAKLIREHSQLEVQAKSDIPDDIIHTRKKKLTKRRHHDRTPEQDSTEFVEDRPHRTHRETSHMKRSESRYRSRSHSPRKRSSHNYDGGSSHRQMIHKQMTNVDILTKCILVLLFILSLINAVLFYTLSDLQEKAIHLVNIRKQYAGY